MSGHPAPRVYSPSLLSYAVNTLDDDTFHHVKAVGVAATVVIGRLFDLTVTRAWCVRVRFDGKGGSVETHSSGGTTAQHLAVYHLAANQGFVRALPPNAHPLAAAAVEEINGQGNLQAALDLFHQGYAVWRRQAEIDAGLLLEEPLLWDKVCDVAAALIDAGALGLDQDQIETLIGDPSQLSDHQIWIPDLNGLDLP